LNYANYWTKKTVAMVAAARAETVGEVVTKTESDIGENRDSGSGIDSDSGGNVGVDGGGGNGGQNRVSCGSGGDSGYVGGRQQQKLQGQATINKMRQR
jgi:hypothetical protein